MSIGYLYAAVGSVHRKEAIASMLRLREVRPDAHVTIVTTEHIDGFDRCVIQPVRDPGRGGIGYKVDALSCEYYDRTLYVDTDVYFVEDISNLFSRAAAEFDMALMLDPAEPEADVGMTAYNTGVILMDNNKNVHETLKLLKDYYSDDDILWKSLDSHPAKTQMSEQPVFMQAVRDTRVKVLPLPSNYNFRYRFPVTIMGSVKLIHGPVPDCGWQLLAKTINTTTGPRVWTRSMVPG